MPPCSTCPLANFPSASPPRCPAGACPAWPTPWWEAWPNPKNYADAAAGSYDDVAGRIIQLTRDHFDSLKIRKQMFLWPFRGDVDAAAYPQFVRLAALLPQSGPAARP